MRYRAHTSSPWLIWHTRSILSKNYCCLKNQGIFISTRIQRSCTENYSHNFPGYIILMIFLDTLFSSHNFQTWKTASKESEHLRACIWPFAHSIHAHLDFLCAFAAEHLVTARGQHSLKKKWKKWGGGKSKIKRSDYFSFHVQESIFIRFLFFTWRTWMRRSKHILHWK